MPDGERNEEFRFTKSLMKSDLYENERLECRAGIDERILKPRSFAFLSNPGEKAHRIAARLLHSREERESTS